jgi:Glycosyltransferase family 87/WD40-like Beta Propeller Repeat
MPHLKLLARVAVSLTTILFLATSFRWGWTRVETDFPNYYTAAALAVRGEPLRLFYDWTWFQRHMNYVGIERQLGAYVPHTPLTLLPMLPLAELPAQRAKQVWLLLNLGFLAGSILLLSHISSFRPANIALLVFVCYGALHSNFVLGQYYVFLLFLLCAGAWLLLNGREFSSGFVMGTIFVLKLYSAPLFLYFLVRRRWRAAAGMGLAGALFAMVAVLMFGWADDWFYVTTIVPRALDGTFTDPYNAGLGSMTALLRKTFVAEPELNPNPTFQFPPAFFFLRALFTVGLLVFSLLAVRRSPEPDVRRDFAWFVVLSFLLSPVIVSYQFVLLVAPVVLIMRPVSSKETVLLILYLGLIGMPLRPEFSWLFPKLWLLLLLYLALGRSYWRHIPRREAVFAGLLVVTVSLLLASEELSNFRQEPLQQRQASAKVEPSAIYSSDPAVTREGMVYQSIGNQRYVLRRTRQGAIETLVFDGHAFHPATFEQGPIFFELVAKGHSSICKYLPDQRKLDTVVEPLVDPINPAVSADGSSLAFVAGNSLYVQRDRARKLVARSPSMSYPAFFPDGNQIAYASGSSGTSQIYVVSSATGAIKQLTNGRDDYQRPAVSPDGKVLAFSSSETGTRQVWVQELSTGLRRRITGGNCNNDAPAWQGAREVIFTSDCGRGYGLPALYKTGM